MNGVHRINTTSLSYRQKNMVKNSNGTSSKSPSRQMETCIRSNTGSRCDIRESSTYRSDRTPIMLVVGTERVADGALMRLLKNIESYPSPKPPSINTGCKSMLVFAALSRLAVKWSYEGKMKISFNHLSPAETLTSVLPLMALECGPHQKKAIK